MGLIRYARLTSSPLWVRSRSVRFGSSAIVGTATYSTGACLIEAYVLLSVSGGTQINAVITHGCQNLEEKKNQMASRKNQEICGGILADLVEKVRHTAVTGKIPMTFRRIYDDKQGHGIFEEEGVNCQGMGGGKLKERTVR